MSGGGGVIARYDSYSVAPLLPHAFAPKWDRTDDDDNLTPLFTLLEVSLWYRHIKRTTSKVETRIPDHFRGTHPQV